MAFGLAFVATCVVHAQDVPKGKAAEPVEAVQAAAQVCATCHGADGNSVTPIYPGLAGQHRAYILKQLQEFKSGERKNPIMSPIAAALSPKEMKSWTDFFSKQKPKPQAANNKALVAAGQKLYRGGNSASGIPACAACHSPNGAGIPAQYPRLAGQHAEYTAAQLRAFRSEERANDANRVMRTIAAKMTDQEMKAAAEYIQGLR
ncbi:MAG: cytochrome c4 [Burkholderiales bacterium]|nr:cytochrome c4 [Burkholderiales bacterium]